MSGSDLGADLLRELADRRGGDLVEALGAVLGELVATRLASFDFEQAGILADRYAPAVRRVLSDAAIAEDKAFRAVTVLGILEAEELLRDDDLARLQRVYATLHDGDFDANVIFLIRRTMAGAEPARRRMVAHMVATDLAFAAVLGGDLDADAAHQWARRVELAARDKT